jgi:hypothetical protein
MHKKVELLGILFWVQGALSVAGALLFIVVGVLGGLGLIEPKDTLQDRIGGALGSALLGAGLGAMGAGQIVVGTALRRVRPWARTAGLVVGVLDIVCCCTAPIGTAIGIYALIVLLNDEVVRLFSDAGPS